MTTVNNKKCYPSEKYLNELITNIEFAARAPVEVVRAIAAELQKHRKAYANTAASKDGWISCSERMPNDAQWCVVNTKYGYYVQCWSEGQGWLGDDISIPECDVINWMPLPEPPQEVK